MPFGPLVAARYGGKRFNQGIGAEMIAAEFGLSRGDLDQHALDSHARAARAIDEGVRRGGTLEQMAAAHGWAPLARFHTGVLAGVDPVTMLKGPVPATAKVLKRSGLSLDRIGAFEINEAFASVSLGWQRQTGADYNLMNPNGGAIALGHPLGASGARLMTTLVHHMKDQGIEFGLQSVCEGGGMANATILELL